MERIAPEEGLFFSDPSTNKVWLNPSGTPVSMTCDDIHRGPGAFSSPESFLPERWIKNPEFEKDLVSFSKGKTQFLGISLVYSQMYVILAKLFGDYESDEVKIGDGVGNLQLFDPISGNAVLVWGRDRSIPLPTPDNGV